MEKNENDEKENKQFILLSFNIALMIASFIIALVALPYELFFIVAVVILIALHSVEKDLKKINPKRITISSILK